MGKVCDINWGMPDTINHDTKREGAQTKNTKNGNQNEDAYREGK